MVAEFVITVGLIEEIVGFVSPTVTDPPSDTAEPFIVIAEFANDELGTAAKRAVGTVPDVSCVALSAVKLAPEPDNVAPVVTVIVSPFSPIVIEEPDCFLIVFTLSVDTMLPSRCWYSVCCY